MLAQVLVNPQRVQRGRIKPGQEHVHHDHQVDLTVLQPQRQVLVVVLKPVRGGVEAGAEHVVVVLDRVLQEIPRTLVQTLGLELLLAQDAVRLGLVRGIAVDQRHLQPLVGRQFVLAIGERVVVPFRRLDGRRREQRVEPSQPLAGERVGGVSFRLLVEVFPHIGHDLADPLGRQQGALGVDRRHLLVGDGVRGFDSVDVVDAERQHVLVVDRVHDRVGVQPVTEGLLGGAQAWGAAGSGIVGEDRRPGEPKQVVVLERLGDRGVHVTELAAMAFVENDHHMPGVDLMLGVLRDEPGQLLDGGDDDAGVRVLQLPLQHPRRRVRVGSTLLEPLVLTHRLVVEVFAIHDEQHLVDLRQLAGQLRRLEAGQCLARPGGVPDVTACRDGAQPPGVGGGFDAPQNLFGGRDLVGTHHQQLVVGIEHAVVGEDVQQGVLGEERAGEPRQIGDRLVVRVRPPTGELVAVGRLLAALAAAAFSQMQVAGGVRVVLRQRAIADHEQLDVLEQAGIGPETVARVAVDLVERLPQLGAPALQFHVHQRQPVHQDRHVVTVGVHPGRRLVLVDHLQPVVVDVLLVEQIDVLERPVITGQHLHVIGLDSGGLLHDAVIRGRNLLSEEPLPLVVGEPDLVQRLQLDAQIRHQIGFAMQRQVLVGLLLQHGQQALFQRGLALMAGLVRRLRDVLRDHRALGTQRDRLVAQPAVVSHAAHPGGHRRFAPGQAVPG